MQGLGTLSPLPDGEGWGAPAALSRSVVALKSLRQSWLGVTGACKFTRECSGKMFNFDVEAEFVTVNVSYIGDLEGSRGSSVGIAARVGFGRSSSAGFSPRPGASAC